VVKEENKTLLKNHTIRDQDRELLEEIDRINSSGRAKRSRYGKKVEDLRIGVNLSPYIVYNNKKKPKENLNNSTEKYYNVEGRTIDHDRLRYNNSSKDLTAKITKYNDNMNALKDNARTHIIKNFRGSFI